MCLKNNSLWRRQVNLHLHALAPAVIGGVYKQSTFIGGLERGGEDSGKLSFGIPRTGN